MGNEGEPCGFAIVPKRPRVRTVGQQPRRAEASTEAALEEDQEQGHRANLLQRDDRDSPAAKPIIPATMPTARKAAGPGRRIRRNKGPKRAPSGEERRRELLGEEVGVFGHGGESPTRLPGTPRARLPASAPRSVISPKVPCLNLNGKEGSTVRVRQRASQAAWKSAFSWSNSVRLSPVWTY